VHFTAPTIHPGFGGTITLEIINFGAASILLTPNMYIAQLLVEQVIGAPKANPSTFQNQSTVAGLPGNGQN
jgi:dCTP deaminase